MSLRSHKIELDPNNKQKTMLAKHCGYARVAYNHALSEFKANLDQDNFMSVIDLRKSFNKVKYDLYPWCKELSQNASSNGIGNLGDAISFWTSKQNQFPRYKKRSDRQSYQASIKSDEVEVEGKRVKLPKIGWVRMRQKLRYMGQIRKCVVSKRAGRWFISILVKVPDSYRYSDWASGDIIGVDVGIKELAVTSDGRFFENPKSLYRYERKLKRAQRSLSRKVKGSKNYQKAKLKVQKIHYRISCIRQNAHQKASTAIVNAAAIIGIESLKVSGLMKNRKLSKALADASLNSFLKMIKYKSNCRGVEVIEADRFFASTKLCSVCSYKKESMSLGERTYTCSACGYVCDRDLNAAYNLKYLAAGLSERINGSGETVRPLSVARFDEVATVTDTKNGQMSFVL